MKHNSLHPRNVRIEDAQELDHDQLKTRTTIALKKLGEQRFSSEPGGYSLDNWGKGVSVLLDDFEEKMGEERLTSEYMARRRELNDFISNPVSTASIDGDISEVARKMADAKGRIDAERRRIKTRLAELTNEQAKVSAELSAEREKAAGQAAKMPPPSLFRRLTRRESKAQEVSRDLADELETKLRSLNAETREQQELLKSIEARSPKSPSGEDWKLLDSLQARLDALEAERTEKVQLAGVRGVITASIADAISKTPT
jgi:hypothetical protein